MKKHFCIAAVAVAAIIGNTFAQVDTVKATIGITPGISLHDTRNSVVHYNASLIAAEVFELQGSSFAGFVSKVKTESNGYHAAGLVTTSESVDGAQLSGIYNSVSKNLTGYQVGGLINRVEGNLYGMQASGLLNIVKGTTAGGQTGFINIAKDITGFQAGFINIADQMNGVPIGIINIAKNGNVSAIAYGSNFSGINTGAKFIVNNFVTTLTVGGIDSDDDIDSAITVATSWGYHIPINQLYVDIDAASMTMTQVTTSDNKNPPVRQLVALRMTAGVDITSWLGVFAGAGAGYETTDEDWDNGDFKPLFFGGVTLF